MPIDSSYAQNIGQICLRARGYFRYRSLLCMYFRFIIKAMPIVCLLFLVRVMTIFNMSMLLDECYVFMIFLIKIFLHDFKMI